MLRLLISLAILLPLVSCKKTPREDGEVLPEAEARTALVEGSPWCERDDDLNGEYSVNVFIGDQSGQRAIWNAKKKQYTSSDVISWSIKEDLLTRVLPKTYTPNVLNERLRFIKNGDGYTVNVSRGEIHIKWDTCKGL